jgi:quercetin dioxygenase-like cupin family protein
MKISRKYHGLLMKSACFHGGGGVHFMRRVMPKLRALSGRDRFRQAHQKGILVSTRAEGHSGVQRAEGALMKEMPMNRFILAALAAVFSATVAFGQEAVKVDTKGLVAKIKFEQVLSGYLTELNGKYKLRVTELTLAPGGHVGEHNHVGPGIRLVTSGNMTYVLPDKTVVYGPGEFFFESGDVNHTVYNKTDAPMVHLLFEILPADLQGPSLIPVKTK